MLVWWISLSQFVFFFDVLVLVFVSFSKGCNYRKPGLCFSLFTPKWHLDTMPQLPAANAFFLLQQGQNYTDLPPACSATLLKHFLQLSCLPSCTETPKFRNVEAQGLDCAVNLPQLIWCALCPFRPFNGSSLSPACVLGSHGQLASRVWPLGCSGSMSLLLLPLLLPIAVFIFAVSPATAFLF